MLINVDLKFSIGKKTVDFYYEHTSGEQHPLLNINSNQNLSTRKYKNSHSLFLVSVFH